MPYPNLQNIAPHVWGPHAWRFMHAVALTYPESPSEEEKKAAMQFFSSLEYLLPCESCKNNYRKELQMFPLKPALESKQKLNEWLTTLHNSVSTRLKKTTMTPEQVLQYVFETKEASHKPPGGPPQADSSPAPTPDRGQQDNTWGIVATCVAFALLVGFVTLCFIHAKHTTKKSKPRK